MGRPTLPELSPSGQNNAVAHPTSVKPQTCDIFASGDNKACKSSWVDFRNGEPAHHMYRSEFRTSLVARGDFRIP